MTKRAVGLALVGVALAVTASVLPASEQVSIDGEQAFAEKKCSMCHSVEAADVRAIARSEKMKGPDLSGFRSEEARSTLAAYLRRESALDGKKHIKPFKGSDEELQAILDWLGSLEAKKTPDS